MTEDQASTASASAMPIQLTGDDAVPEKRRRGSIWVLFIAVVLSTLQLVVAGALLIIWEQLGFPQSEIALTIIILTAVTVLLTTLGGFVIIFHRLGLVNSKAAMGLPDGSIRAVIALLLLLVFSVVAVFLVNIARIDGSSGRVVEGVSADYADSYPRDDVLERVRAGGTDTAPLYNLRLRSAPNESADDLSKQLLTTLGTLAVAVAAFYFGANSVTTGVKAATDPSESASARTTVNTTPNPSPASTSATPTNPAPTVGPAPSRATAPATPPAASAAGGTPH